MQVKMALFQTFIETKDQVSHIDMQVCDPLSHHMLELKSKMNMNI